MTKDNSITLLVPTYNRVHFVERCLLHFNRDECAYRIIIADGSHDKEKKANEALTVELGQNLNVEYHSFPTELSFSERCYEALNLVKTPYSAMHADDDFYFTDGYNELATALESRPDLIAVQGRIMIVRRENEHFRVMPYLYQDVLQNTPVERLMWHMRSYRPTFYSLHRTETFTKALKNAVACKSFWPRMFEISLSALIAIQGRFAFVDTFQGIRESHAEALSKNDMNWNAIAVSPKFSEVLDLYARVIAEEIYRNEQNAIIAGKGNSKGVSLQDLDNDVRKAFLAFLKIALVPSSRPRVKELTSQSWETYDIFAKQKNLAQYSQKIRDSLKVFL